MKITIQKAKNGENTATADGYFLHSNYAPVKEAERFVENLKLPYTPKTIIVLEPCLSYCADFFHKKFPEIRIGAIRYHKDFEKYNCGFDFILNYFETPDFETFLEKKFNEEELLSTFFISWPASSQVFKEIENDVWQAIKNSMERSKTLLITRQYFEKKWLVNSCYFLRYVHNILTFNNKIEKDVLIISSGPSLIPYINYIRKNQNNFFILCLSSAISVCLENQIIPDLCMTTDGGFWAGEHLKKLKGKHIPVAMPSEAFCSKALLKELHVLPLIYGDGISKELTETSGIICKKAVRNGTVSGTALLFAVQYFTKNIFMFGLDMANQKGFQHTQPNELELNSTLKDNRIKNKETRLSKSELTNGSLDIYRNWFSTNKIECINRQVYRVIEKSDRKNNLGWIQDIDFSCFSKLTQNNSSTKTNPFIHSEFHCDCSKLFNIINDEEKAENIKHQLYPLDYVSLIHNNGSEVIIQKIENEWYKLKNKLSGILKDDL